MGRPIGAFGKIPATGDFIRFATPRGFVSVWDPWLQGVMAQARSHFGDGWEATYLSAPIWRFSLAPDIAGPAAVSGILMPSVDAAGRYFPLTFVSVAEDGGDEAFFDATETVALAALSEDLAPERIADRLNEVTDVPPLLSRGTRWSSSLGDGSVTSLTFPTLPDATDAAVLFGHGDARGSHRVASQ
ncbi:type VI secretion system-associated protein TagF [Qingshengfaniella alkalisoli]|uniref:Type VI secretion system-associated protein TagF n=1 Tax=Qingshengfaniella alkalisoli TaxID=2599296 RepID=A0A5B8I9G6_9RHOB|nr:type VI secretion system-associated protein TagF [Qingshengfaniella alkalisoli]QDY70915.1 type VI secretion system-associated protein TagF [Qingshengfaniella alkalisoli]